MLVAGVGAMLAGVSPVGAQSIVDPAAAEFPASAQHSATASDGTPLVTRYELQFFLQGASLPMQTSSVGKPTPNASNIIRVPFSSLPSMPPPGSVYESRVVVVGPGGSATSALSNTFAFSVPCTYTVTSSVPATVPSTAGTGSASVSAATGCTWAAASNASWLTITSGASGTASGTVSFSIAANTSTTARTGTLTVAGQTITVSQAGATLTCAPSVSPLSVTASAAGISSSVSVTAATGCAWAAASNSSWITVTAGATGTGNGTVTFGIAANTVTTARSGSLTVAGRTVTVDQAAGTGQTTSNPTVDPTVVQFGASPDHSTTASDGTPLVSRYDLAFFQTGATAPFQTTSMGKPTPDASNVIRWNLSGMTAWPSAGITYEARVLAVGPGGSAQSNLSNPFVFSAPCTYAVSAPSLSFPSSGGTANASVTTGGACAWAAASSASWLTISAGSSGVGNGTVTYVAAPNTTTSARTATLTAAGQTFTISQAASTSSCTYGLSSTSQNSSAAGGTLAVAVTTTAGCTWNAVSDAAWLTITSGASGTGSGTVSLNATQNTTTVSRVGHVTVNGLVSTITQAGQACSYGLGTTSTSMPASGGNGSVSVTGGTGCTWTATSNAAWLTVTGGASGTGVGTTTFSVAANTGSTSRSGTLTIAGQTFTVSEAAAACAYTVSPTSLSSPAAGGALSFDVTTTATCNWSGASDVAWLTLTSAATGTGNATMALNAAANTTTSSRIGHITVNGQVVTITQAAPACALTLSTSAFSMPASGGTGSVSVTGGTGCTWTAAANAAWLTVTTGATGAGAGTTTFSVAANTSTTSRTGTLTVAGQTVSVMQGGATPACTYSVSPTSVTGVVAAGTTASISVLSGTGCAWAASSNAGWITIGSGATGSGNGVVGYSVAANTSTTTRSGTLNVAGTTVTISQGAAPCSFTLSSTSANVADTASTGTVNVTSGSGCNWTASSSATWLTITSGASGTAAGSVAYSVAANTRTRSRTGTMTIAGQIFTVTQAAAAPCTFTVAPISHTPSAAGGSFSGTVTASGSTCGWTSTSPVAWVTMTTGATGTGTGTYALSVAANTTTASRSATVTVAGMPVTVTQAAPAPSCPVTLTPPRVIVDDAAGSASVFVLAASTCTWTASSGAAWLTVNGSATGTGDGSIDIQVAANTGAERTGTITVNGSTLTVTQVDKNAPNPPQGIRIVPNPQY